MKCQTFYADWLSNDLQKISYQGVTYPISWDKYINIKLDDSRYYLNIEGPPLGINIFLTFFTEHRTLSNYCNYKIQQLSYRGVILANEVVFFHNLKTKNRQAFVTDCQTTVNKFQPQNWNNLQIEGLIVDK